MEIIPVRTSPSYDVIIGPGLLPQCGERLREVMAPCHVAVITDSNVAPLYLEGVKKSLEDAGFTVSTCSFPAGEASKNFSTLSGILEFLARRRLTRADCVAALGGGVVGDMAGFAAAVYLRGVKYVQMPTTLLAAVDSSVGGKTAVDLAAGKNLAGAFLQPAAVLCDTDCLSTLTPHFFADGAAEAIKTGVLCDEDLFALFEEDKIKTDPQEVIARCVRYKAGVVERDEKEQGERKLLNLGHTVGHAIEKCSGYSVTHGHAVAAGMAVIARAAEALGWTEGPLAGRLADCLTKNGLPAGTSFSAEELSDAALSDKKRTGGEITLAVPRRVGHCELKTIPVSDLPPVIRAGLSGGEG